MVCWKTVKTYKSIIFRYNGAPFFAPAPKLDVGDAVVIGNGNVAIDCSRILLSPCDRLAQTDITESALHTLRKSKVRNLRVLGRRGPKEVNYLEFYFNFSFSKISFTIKELRELLTLERVHAHCAIGGDVVEQLQQELPKMERPRRRLMELMLSYAAEGRAQQVEKMQDEK